jgi:hypothetical protein
MSTRDVNEILHRARGLIESIKPLLAGQGFDAQGAALVELVALYIAGHAPPLRDELLALHVEAVRLMIPAIERELFGPAGHPGRAS